MKKIIITGCNGQLGKEINRYYSEKRGLQFINTDVAELDITDIDAVMELARGEQPYAIINCAAYTAVDACETNQDLAFKINVLGPRNLAIATEAVGAKLVHISTDYVFDGKQSVPCSENDPTYPLNVYGKTKIFSEQMVRYACKKSFILRTAWLYSEYGNNFVKTMKKMLNVKDSVSVVFDQVGSPTYARDLAGVIIDIIKMKLIVL